MNGDLVNLSVTLAPLSADAGVRGLSRLSLAEFHLDCHMRVLLCLVSLPHSFTAISSLLASWAQLNGKRVISSGQN